jgi:hypothetical protein
VTTRQLTSRKRRKTGMSAAARKKVSLAQTKRWAEWRKKAQLERPSPEGEGFWVD